VQTGAGVPLPPPGEPEPPPGEPPPGEPLPFPGHVGVPEVGGVPVGLARTAAAKARMAME
jgi:hypothetical protein